MEQEEVDIQYKGQIITLRVPKGTSEEKIKEYLDKNMKEPSRMEQFARAAAPDNAVTAYGTSAINSALFGLPEVAARAVGGGAFFDEMRRQSPYASTAGDVTGLIVPGSLFAKGTQKGISALASRGAGTAEDTMTILRTGQANPVLQAAGRVGKRAAELGSGVVGAQVSATTQGAARSPENPMVGAQQGAMTFRDVASNLPGTNLVPGLQPTINTLTSAVPATLGYGSMFFNRPSQPAAPVAPTDFEMDRRIREEAYRRSMGLQ